MKDAERMCERIAFIVAGKIVALGSVEELMKSVSHGYRLQLTADGSIAQYAAGLQARFEGSAVTADRDNTLIITTHAPISLLPVTQYFDEKGIPLYEARQIRPTLEDVFVKVTGIEADKLKKEKEKGGAGK
jgi:ABC-2 type transport system ATP-binding protein